VGAAAQQWAGTFQLTATGGPVDTYSVSVPSTLASNVTVTLSTTAPLAVGQVVTVTVTANAAGLAGALTVNPGNIPITIAYQTPT
jgi:hypothetical protein